MKKRKPLTRKRSRIEKLIRTATQSNLKCCVWLHIENGMSHDGVLDELFEDFMKAEKRISFPTIEIPQPLCIRSSQRGCIAPEDALIVNGELCDVLSREQPTYVDEEQSQIWHFAGGMYSYLDGDCFCEYDANTRKGGIIAFFDGSNIPEILARYPQLKQKIKIADPRQIEWMHKNW